MTLTELKKLSEQYLCYDGYGLQPSAYDLILEFNLLLRKFEEHKDTEICCDWKFKDTLSSYIGVEYE